MKRDISGWQQLWKLFKLTLRAMLSALIAFFILIVFAGINVEVSRVWSYIWVIFAVVTWIAVSRVRHKKKLSKTLANTKTESDDEPIKDIQESKPTEDIAKQSQQIDLLKQKEERISCCKYDLVVIDFETTGLNSDPFHGRMDEILSVAIIDQDGNTLLSTLCGTDDRKTWTKAQEIHGITPAMVKDKPTFSEILPQVKDILYSAKQVIAYNIPFEMGFLWSYDAMNDYPGGTKIREMVDWGPDPMLMFAAYKGELSKYGDAKWHKLTTAAKHFKYSFKEHDALEDVKATLHVYKALLKYIETYEDKKYILKYGMGYKKPGH